MSNQNTNKTHCKHGHPLSGDNVITHKNGHRDCRECGRMRCRKYYHNNIEAGRGRCRKWSSAKKENQEYTKKNGKKADRKTRAIEAMTDPIFSIVERTRARIRKTITRAYRKPNKRQNIIDLLGCSYEDLKLHIESQFTNGITWEKCMLGEIHLDHIRPLASFDLSDAEQQKHAFHFTNVDPRWRADNLKKGSIWNGERHKHKRIITKRQTATQ